MSRKCDICNKGYMKANLVPRGIGRRVTNRAIKRQQPNIRNKRLTIKGVTKVYAICSSCLKRRGFDAKKKAEAQKALEQPVEVIKEEPVKKEKVKVKEKAIEKKKEKKEEKKVAKKVTKKVEEKKAEKKVVKKKAEKKKEETKKKDTKAKKTTKKKAEKKD